MKNPLLRSSIDGFLDITSQGTSFNSAELAAVNGAISEGFGKAFGSIPGAGLPVSLIIENSMDPEGTFNLDNNKMNDGFSSGINASKDHVASRPGRAPSMQEQVRRGDSIKKQGQIERNLEYASQYRQRRNGI